MNRLLPEVTVVLTISFLTLFLLSKASPVRDGYLGPESDAWHGTVDQKFYGPWSDLKKINGENSDYNDYESHIQDFQNGPEDVPSYEPEEIDDGPADFSSNYGEFTPDTYFQPNQEDHSADDYTGQSENHDNEGNVKWTTE